MVSYACSKSPSLFFLTALLHPTVLAHEPLRVSLEDLQSADSKGKWWLVGAAWGGDPLVDKQGEFTNKSSSIEPDEDDSAKLIKLARSQGMNTDIRRGIFVVLMSSDVSFVLHFQGEKIVWFSLLGRIILMHARDYLSWSSQKSNSVKSYECCFIVAEMQVFFLGSFIMLTQYFHQERTHNPYYTVVGQQLCRSSHAHKITLQYCLWDFLRDLGEARVGGAAVVKNAQDSGDFVLQNISQIRLHNVAKAYGWWIAKDSISLHVLKVYVCAVVSTLMDWPIVIACWLHSAQTSIARVFARTIHPNLCQQSEINAADNSGFQGGWLYEEQERHQGDLYQGLTSSSSSNGTRLFSIGNTSR